MAEHREQAARCPAQNNEEGLEYLAPQMTLLENRIKYGTGIEAEAYLPNAGRQMDRIAVNIPTERLPVILEENETAKPNETRDNE